MKRYIVTQQTGLRVERLGCYDHLDDAKAAVNRAVGGLRNEGASHAGWTPGPTWVLAVQTPRHGTLTIRIEAVEANTLGPLV